MGFIVDHNGLVSVDHDSKSYGITTVKGNYTRAKTRCAHNPLRVFSIFLRRSYKGSGKGKGDNCPFIYGIKKKRGLKVNYSSVKALHSSMTTIIEEFSKAQRRADIQYDLIIPMPSSHSISYIVSRRLSKVLPGSIVENGFFRKSSSEDIRRQLSDESIPHGAKVNISNAINLAEESGLNFSLSDVDTANRKYLRPIELITAIPKVDRILLVDDLFATGTTLITAKELIKHQYPGVVVEAMCLFSPLDGRIKQK